MFRRARLFLELIRFSHTVFALPFALLSAVLAWQSPGVEFRRTDLLGIVLCMVFARSAALAHFWLGASLMLAPLAAWIAIRGPADLAAPTVLGLAVLFWVSGFDILYACQDVEPDRRLGLRSVPAAVGVPAALRVAAVCHGLTAALLVALYFVGAPVLGRVYLTGMSAVVVLLAYEHWL